MDIGLKTIINRESMTGIAVAAEAQVPVPGQVATIEAVIKTLTVRGLLSVPSLNFFKILNLMRCQPPFMIAIREQPKLSPNGQQNQVLLIRSSKACRLIQLPAINPSLGWMALCTVKVDSSFNSPQIRQLTFFLKTQQLANCSKRLPNKNTHFYTI